MLHKEQLSSRAALLLVVGLAAGVACSLTEAAGEGTWTTRRLSFLNGNTSVFAWSNGTSSGMVMPLGLRQGLRRSRNLLRGGVMNVDGAVREVGYFYATLGLGTPSRNFDLIIDTGSTVTYVPCSDCKHCGKHKDPAFNPKASSTAIMLPCNTPKCNCGSPACQCLQNKCFYSRTYAERSSSEGFLLEDVFAFPDYTGSLPEGTKPAEVKVVFGCEQSETGEIYRQVADGILGMGHNTNALQSQLVEQKVIADTFSLCFGYPSGGSMLLGEVPVENHNQMVYTALKPGWQTHYYTVTMSHISIDDQRVPVDASLYARGYGAVLDSGTTFTYFPTEAFNKFAEMIGAAAEKKGLSRRPGADPQYNDICWKGAPDDVKQLGKVFPKVEMVFAGNAVLELKPLQYLFVIGGGSYCLGIFDNGNSGTLLGGITVRNVLVEYDRRNNRAGFLPVEDCKALQKPPKVAPITPTITPVSSTSTGAASAATGVQSSAASTAAAGASMAAGTSKLSPGTVTANVTKPQAMQQQAAAATTTATAATTSATTSQQQATQQQGQTAEAKGAAPTAGADKPAASATPAEQKTTTATPSSSTPAATPATQPKANSTSTTKPATTSTPTTATPATATAQATQASATTKQAEQQAAAPVTTTTAANHSNHGGDMHKGDAATLTAHQEHIRHPAPMSPLFGVFILVLASALAAYYWWPSIMRNVNGASRAAAAGEAASAEERMSLKQGASSSAV